MTGLFSIVGALMLTAQFYGVKNVNFEAQKHFEPVIRDVFVPIGFDDNDLVQVVVEVEFRDTCEEISRSAVMVHPEDPRVLLLFMEAYRRDGVCLQVINRQPKVIDIGVLREGRYEIRSYSNLNRKFSDLNVRRAATSRIDDHNYAPVDSLILSNDANGARRILTLTGRFSNTCLKFEQILIAKTRSNLIEVLPVIKKEERWDCEDREMPFVAHQPLPEHVGERAITTGRYLFHVRTTNGGSFNKIDTVVMDPRDANFP